MEIDPETGFEYLPRVKSKDVREIIGALYRVLKQDEYYEVDLTSAHVQFDNPKDPTCGSPACFAGAFWIGRALQMIDGDPRHAEDLFRSERVHWSEGAEQIALLLGFDTIQECADWFDDHELIWGNDNGAELFSDIIAYEPDRIYAGENIRLCNVIEHWEGVADRLEHLEAEVG